MGRDIKILPPPPSNKEVQYRQLVEKRKQCSLCSTLTNPSRWPEYDSSEIGPWSRWQANLDADLMVVGQDFMDANKYEKNEGLDDSDNYTNENLVELLRSVGIQIPLNVLRGPKGTVFLTNAILCLKPSKAKVGTDPKKTGMQAEVEDEWLSACGSRFLKPQIDLVNPKVLVCLGQKAYDSVAYLYHLPKAPLPYRDLVENQTGCNLAGLRTQVLGLYHCGRRIVNTTRSMKEQRADWVIVKRLLEAI